jgi:hypothetical protein
MMNVFMGFEQANRYVIMNVNGEHVGYLAEEDQGIMSTITRQVLRTHRPFKCVPFTTHRFLGASSLSDLTFSRTFPLIDRW